MAVDPSKKDRKPKDPAVRFREQIAQRQEKRRSNKERQATRQAGQKTFFVSGVEGAVSPEVFKASIGKGSGGKALSPQELDQLAQIRRGEGQVVASDVTKAEEEILRLTELEEDVPEQQRLRAKIELQRAIDEARLQGGETQEFDPIGRLKKLGQGGFETADEALTSLSRSFQRDPSLGLAVTAAGVGAAAFGAAAVGSFTSSGAALGNAQQLAGAALAVGGINKITNIPDKVISDSRGAIESLGEATRLISQELELGRISYEEALRQFETTEFLINQLESQIKLWSTRDLTYRLSGGQADRAKLEKLRRELSVTRGLARTKAEINLQERLNERTQRVLDARRIGRGQTPVGVQ